MYSTKGIMGPVIWVFARNFFPSKISRKVVRRWNHLDDQNSDHFSDWKYLFLFFEISSKVCEWKVKLNMPSRRQLWRHDCNYDVIHFVRIFEIEYLRNWKRHRHKSFTVVIYSTKAIIWRLISITAKKKNHFQRYHEKSYTVGSVWMSRFQITFQNENISSTFSDIVENMRTKSLIQNAEEGSIIT